MEQKTDNSLYKSILGAFLILIMHVLLLGIIGLLVLVFHGIINYMGWIILGISLSVVGWWYWFYRRMKSDREKIRNIVGDSLLKGKSVEISFLGGAATFKLNNSDSIQTIETLSEERRQLSGPAPEYTDKLTELARLYEKNLITDEEYDKAKKRLLE
jgi:hypothetical protein